MPVPAKRPTAAIRRTGRPTVPAAAAGRRRRPARSGGGSGMQSWIVWALIVFVVLPLIGFGIRLGYKSSDGKQVLGQAHELIANAPDYAAHRAYYDRIVDECHPAAFDQAYRIGGRREANTLNEKQYLRLLFTGMKASAARDGEKEVAETCGRIAANF